MPQTFRILDVASSLAEISSSSCLASDDLRPSALVDGKPGHARERLHQAFRGSCLIPHPSERDIVDVVAFVDRVEDILPLADGQRLGYFREHSLRYIDRDPIHANPPMIRNHAGRSVGSPTSGTTAPARAAGP